MSLKNSNDTFGNRTLTTKPPRARFLLKYIIIIIIIIIII